MEDRLRQYFASHPEAPRMRVDATCRPSQCLLRIVDTNIVRIADRPDTGARGYAGTTSYNAGQLGLRPDGKGVGGIMWELTQQSWFTANFQIELEPNVHMGFGDYEFGLVRLIPRKACQGADSHSAASPTQRCLQPVF